MRSVLLLAALAVAAIAAVALRARNDPAAESSALDLVADPVRSAFGAGADLAESVGAAMRDLWKPPAAAAPYLGAIESAEQSVGAPPGLVARVIYQESRFRPDIINGTTRSKAGAVGIGQMLPGTAAELGVDPLNPDQAIDGTARYLRQLFDKFGSWGDAVAAYNWGPGNWAAYLRTGKGARGQERPEENVKYLSEIAADVGLEV